MFRISQWRLACCTTLFAALGVYAALPVGAAQPQVARVVSGTTSSPPRSLAHAVIANPLILSPIVTPGKHAASGTQQQFTQALAGVADKLAQLPDRPFPIAGNGPAMRGTRVAQTERLDLYVGVNTFSPDQIANLADHIEQVLRDDESWFGTRLTRRVSLGFYQPATAQIRGTRGMAFTDEARAEVYFARDEDVGKAMVIVAHELGHHLEAARYGNAVQRCADTMLHEGLATWITGGRWLAMRDATSWRQRARQLRDAGIPLRLLTAEQSGADNAYEMWASFSFYLAHTYGWEKYDALYRSSRGRYPGSADYEGVLGKSLDALSSDWRAWVGG